MGFFRSSESKSSRSKSRFSFRRHSDDAADIAPPVKPSAPPPPPSAQTRKLHSSSHPTQSSARPPAHPQGASSSASSAANTSASASLRGTIVSSASTSASSSISSPTALQRADNDSEIEVQKPTLLTAKRSSDSRVSTDTEDSSEFVRTPSESCSLLATPRESFELRDSINMSHPDGSSATTRIPDDLVRHGSRSDSLRASQVQTPPPSGRHSLVGYSKLHCSMSYKNRMAQGSGGDDPLMLSTSASSTSLRASFNTSGVSRRSESGRSSSARMSRGSGSYHVHSRENSGLTHIDELATAAATSSSSSAVPCSSSSASAGPKDTTPLSQQDYDDVSSAAASSILLTGRMSELRLNEASVAALQTRRAFQQMVLAMEDDGDSSDYDDSDSESYSFSGVSRHSTVGNFSSAASSGGIVQLGADDYRKFQFRLRQLEELTAEQAQRQATMEESIEREVAARTTKVVDAMEKKIAMYKQAKDLEVEREIQRRVSETGRLTSLGGSRESSLYGSHMLPPMGTPPTASGPLGASSDLKGKPLDKLFHPRRTRRRMEQLREREEQQKREMEQFREFIRSTELHSTRATGVNAAGFHQDLPSDGVVVVSESARASIKALRDPHITEDLLSATQNELIEMICVLRKHVSVQETQLDEAKRLISAAIEAREEAEETAREAVELTMELDSRLERASQEIVVIKDELRRSSDFSMRSSYLMSSMGPADRNSSHVAANGNASGHLPRTASFPNF